MLKIKYCSDIHQEINNSDVLDISLFDTMGLENIDVLIVAGDLAEFPHNTMVCSKILDKYPNLKIIEVPGNHNYYRSKDMGLSIQEIDDICRDMNKKYPNYYYLNNDTITIDGIKFIGSTMWTKCGEHAGIQMLIRNSLNDFNYILNDNGQTISVQDVVEMCKKSIKYIINQVNKSNEKCVVITHHAPFFEYYTDISHAFGIDLSKELKKLKEIPELWIYGHTHVNKNTYIQVGDQQFELEVVCNQRGHKNESDWSPIFNAYKTFKYGDWNIEL